MAMACSLCGGREAATIARLDEAWLLAVVVIVHSIVGRDEGRAREGH